MDEKDYDLAKTVLDKLSSGVDFGELAGQYSQDEATRYFGGDAGFVNLQEALPEFRERVVTMSTGQVAVVASRHGLHVVKVADVVQNPDSATLYHVYDILLSSVGATPWRSYERSTAHFWSFVH